MRLCVHNAALLITLRPSFMAGIRSRHSLSPSEQREFQSVLEKRQTRDMMQVRFPFSRESILVLYLVLPLVVAAEKPLHIPIFCFIFQYFFPPTLLLVPSLYFD